VAISVAPAVLVAPQVESQQVIILQEVAAVQVARTMLKSITARSICMLVCTGGGGFWTDGQVSVSDGGNTVSGIFEFVCWCNLWHAQLFSVFSSS
jgi:hypothetical protein